MRAGLRLPRGRLPLAAALVCALLVLAFSARWFLGQAAGLREARAALSGASREAALLGARRDKAGQAREEFARAAAPLARDAAAGSVLASLEEAAALAGVRVTLAASEERVEGVWQGHFRAVPWKLEAVGSGPAVQAFLAGCEALPFPGELRVFSVEEDPDPAAPEGQVRASCVLVLYSTDPPLDGALLPEPRPRADAWRPPGSWAPPAPAAGVVGEGGGELR